MCDIRVVSPYGSLTKRLRDNDVDGASSLSRCTLLKTFVRVANVYRAECRDFGSSALAQTTRDNGLRDFSRRKNNAKMSRGDVSRLSGLDTYTCTSEN